MNEEKKSVALFLKVAVSKKYEGKGVGISCAMFFDNLSLGFSKNTDLLSGLMNKYDFMGDNRLALRSLIAALEYFRALNVDVRDVNLHVYTDSPYLESRLAIIKRLSRNHFYSSDDSPIDYSDDWREISLLVDCFGEVGVSLCYPSSSEKMLFVSDKVDMLLD